MAQLSCVSDTEALVQSMLKRLHLQEQRSEQASTTSEDLTQTLQEEVENGMCESGERQTSTVGDNPWSPRTKWPGFTPLKKGSTKHLLFQRGSTGQKDSLSFSDTVEEIPRYERKQLRFALISDQSSERKHSPVDEVDSHLKPPLNHENHTSPTGGTDEGPKFSEMQTQKKADAQGTDSMRGEELSTQLTPGSTGFTGWDTITTEDYASSIDSHRKSQDSQDVDQVVTSKTSNNERKNKRKWSETKTRKFTQKIKDKWKDRRSSVEKKKSQNGGKEYQHNTDERVSSKVSSEVKENVVLPPPITIREAEREFTRCPQGYDSISLSAFDMGFSTGSLMEEILTGPEWSKFLALSDSPHEVPENTNDNSTYLAPAKQCDNILSHDHSTYLAPAKQCDNILSQDHSSDLAAAKQCDNILSQDASSQPEKKLNGDTEMMLVDTTDAVPIVDQPLYSESSKHSFNQLASSGPVSYNQSPTLASLGQVSHNQSMIGSGPVSHNQSLTSSAPVSHNQSWTLQVNSDQASPPELNSDESLTNTNNTDQSNIGDQPDQCFPTGSDSITCDIDDRETHMDDVHLDQSEFGSQSNAGDEDQQIHRTEPDLNQISTGDMNPYQSEITNPDINQNSASDMNPYQTEITMPDLNQASDTNPYQTEITTPDLNQASTRDTNPYQTEITTPDFNQTSTSEINPYQTQTGDQSETGDITSCQSTTPTISSSPGQGDAPQFIPLLDLSFLKTGDDVDSSGHKRNRRTQHSEERETFIDEDDDDGVPSKPVFHQKVQPSPPPFPPPPPPSQLITQRSISSDSSASLEIVTKKRRLDDTPRRVRFAEEVVMLPSYIQPEVEDWTQDIEDDPQDMDDSEDPEDPEDPEDMDDTEDPKVPEEITAAKEAEKSAQRYHWIFGKTRKAKRKAQN